MLAFGKVLACSLSIGIGGSGGVFAPSLFIGVTSGMAYGDIMNHVFGAGAGPPALYAVVAMGAVAALMVVLALGPLFLGAYAIDRLTTLFIYVLLATMWNALAGYGGLVSVGQQAFFGIGAYAAIRLSSFGLPVYPALVLGAVFAGAVAYAVSGFALPILKWR